MWGSQLGSFLLCGVTLQPGKISVGHLHISFRVSEAKAKDFEGVVDGMSHIFRYIVAFTIWLRWRLWVGRGGGSMVWGGW